MSPTVINGLAAHVLFVHVVVVLVPLTALVLVLCAARPALGRRLGLLLPILGFVTLASVPLTTHAGEWLARHVGRDPLVRKHAELGDTMLPWALGLFVLTAAVWWWVRRSAAHQGDTTGGAVAVSTTMRATAVVLSLIVAVGSVATVYRIGDSGAKAAWHDNFSQSALPHGDN